jgi:maleylpyruvate isomerase
MTQEPTGRTVTAEDAEVTEVRELLAAANRRLLGDTIAVDDADWRADSRLPGWSRGHVATHLARHADAITRLADWAASGVEQQMYPRDRNAEIDAGADRNGLEIQTDLDTSADRLSDAFDRVAEADAWDREVRLRDGSPIPARLLPSCRLFEVVVHHLDLDLGLTIDAVDERTAEWCLRWAAVRQGRRQGYPSIRMTTDAGSTISIGAADDTTIEVAGPANRLLGWLTRRSGTDGLRGELVELPGLD